MPNLGFCPELTIQKDQYFMNILGEKEQGQMCTQVWSKEKDRINGAKQGSHSHMVVTKRYNVIFVSLSTNGA